MKKKFRLNNTLYKIKFNSICYVEMRKISKGNSLKPAKQIQKLFLLFSKIIFKFFLERNNYFSLFLKVKEEKKSPTE